MKQSTLKRKTPLKAHKRINRISPKQAAINQLWNEITNEKAAELDYICQWCKEPGQRDDKYHIFPPMGYLDGHHIIKRRANIHTKENCYVCHRLCHNFIDDHNIDVKKYPDKETWEVRNLEYLNHTPDNISSRPGGD